MTDLTEACRASPIGMAFTLTVTIGPSVYDQVTARQSDRLVLVRLHGLAPTNARRWEEIAHLAERPIWRPCSG